MLTIKIVAILANFSASALAHHVYSQFYTSTGVKIARHSFDVGNNACFAADHATDVTFTQAGYELLANGPYCLYAWLDTGCSGTPGNQQQFRNVDLAGEVYKLHRGVAHAGSFKWATKKCP